MRKPVPIAILLLSLGLLAFLLVPRGSRQEDHHPTAQQPAGEPPPERPARPGNAPASPPSASGLHREALTETEEERLAAVVGDTSLTDTQATAGLLAIAVNHSEGLGMRREALEHALNLLSESQLHTLRPLIDEARTPPTLVYLLLEHAYNVQDPLPSLELATDLLASSHTTVHEGAHELVAFLLDVDADADREALLAEARGEIDRMRRQGGAEDQ